MPVPNKLPTLSKTDLKITMVGQETGTMSGLAEALAGQRGRDGAGCLRPGGRKGFLGEVTLELSHEGQAGVPWAGWVGGEKSPKA